MITKRQRDAYGQEIAIRVANRLRLNASDVRVVWASVDGVFRPHVSVPQRLHYTEEEVQSVVGEVIDGAIGADLSLFEHGESTKELDDSDFAERMKARRRG